MVMTSTYPNVLCMGGIHLLYYVYLYLQQDIDWDHCRSCQLWCWVASSNQSWWFPCWPISVSALTLLANRQVILLRSSTSLEVSNPGCVGRLCFLSVEIKVGFMKYLFQRRSKQDQPNTIFTQLLRRFITLNNRKITEFFIVCTYKLGTAFIFVI